MQSFEDVLREFEDFLQTASTIVPMCYIAPASRHGRLAFLRFWSQSAAVHRFSYDTAANFIFGRESHARS